nr:TniQ family protein [Thermaceae bacterium]
MKPDTFRKQDIDVEALWMPVSAETYAEHSRLHSLHPLGVGTPFAESLGSLTMRLAATHSVTLDTLITREILPLFDRTYLTAGGGISGTTWGKLSAINGTGAWSAKWVSILEELTKQADLSALTMLPWAAVLPPRGLLRRTRAWCPVCLHSWRADSPTAVYEPLLWALDSVVYCPLHNTPIVSICAACGHSGPSLAVAGRVGFCHRCGEWLGMPGSTAQATPPQTKEQTLWPQYVGSAVGELIVLGAQRAWSPSRERLARTMAGYRDSIAGGDIRELARTVGLSPRSVGDIVDGHQIPKLGTLLQIAYRLGTTPAALTGAQSQGPPVSAQN